MSNSPNLKLDAERCIIGSILMDNKAIWECGDMRADYFGLDIHQRIFSKMLELDGAAKAIDMITLGDAMGWDRNSHEYATLEDILLGTVERPSIALYVDMVRDSAKRRHLAMACQELIGHLDDKANDTNDLLDIHEDLILRLRSAGLANKSVHVREVMDSVLDEVCRQREHKDELVGLSTGIDSIDYTTTGIRPGEYWVIGAAPSRGKTVLGAQIIAANVSTGIPAIAFTYEMTKEQFVKRMIPAESKVQAQTIRDFRQGTDEEEKRVKAAGAAIAEWPFWVCDPEGMTAPELAAVAKLHIRRNGVKLVVVDYLQIINGPGDIRTRVGAVSNALRSLAKSENVAVIALSQLRRPASEDERPTMFHLKETGDIEAHAHCILLLYRPKNEMGSWTGRDEIIIAKQREGLVGSDEVVLHNEKLRFEPREKFL